MELPKVTPFDKEGQSGVIRPNGPGWMVTSGNISTGSGIGKFLVVPFHHQPTTPPVHHQLTPPPFHRVIDEPQPCNYRAISGSVWGEIPPCRVQTLLKMCIFEGVLGVEGWV